MKHNWRLTLIAVACYALSVLFFAPRFYEWLSLDLSISPPGDTQAIIEQFYRCTSAKVISPETLRAVCELVRLQDPGIVIHGVGDTIRWRLLFPVVGHALHLSPLSFLLLPFVFCLLLLIYVAHLAYKRTEVGGKGSGSYLCAWATTALVATSSAIFTSTGFLAYFDSALLLAIMVAAFSRDALPVWIAAMLGPWIDERFIFALPIIAWVQWRNYKGAIEQSRIDRIKNLKSNPKSSFYCSLVRFSIALRLPALWLGIAPYLIFRLAALSMHTDGTTPAYLSELLRSPHDPLKLLWGFWDALRWGWLFVIVAMAAAPGLKRIFAITIIPMSLAVLQISSGDYSRSMAVALPMMLLGIFDCCRLFPNQKTTWTVIAVAFLNFLTPAHHSFRAFQMPIRPLWQQLRIGKLYF